MPYTAKQRRYFNANRDKPGLGRLADEANQMAKAGKELPAKKGGKKSAKRPTQRKGRAKGRSAR